VTLPVLISRTASFSSIFLRVCPVSWPTTTSELSLTGIIIFALFPARSFSSIFPSSTVTVVTVLSPSTVFSASPTSSIVSSSTGTGAGSSLLLLLLSLEGLALVIVISYVFVVTPSWAYTATATVLDPTSKPMNSEGCPLFVSTPLIFIAAAASYTVAVTVV